MASSDSVMEELEPATTDSSCMSSELNGASSGSSTSLLELSYSSSSFGGSESDSEGSEGATEVLPFMYEPLLDSSTSESSEDSDDSGGTDPRLENLNW